MIILANMNKLNSCTVKHSRFARSVATDLRRGNIFCSSSSQNARVKELLQESRAVARKPCNAAAVLFGLKFKDDIHYKFKSSKT